MPITESTYATGSPPQCNPTGEGNELRPTRGAYTLSLAHESFEEGLLAPLEERLGCVSFGQWRHYTLDSPSGLAANVYLELDEPIGQLLALGGFSFGEKNSGK